MNVKAAIKETSLPVRTLDVNNLSASGKVINLAPDASERKAIAKYLDILSLDGFAAKLNFHPRSKGTIEIEGEISASLQTACAITLKPVIQEIATSFSASFVPADSHLAKPQLNDEGEIVLDYEAADSVDIYEGDVLDCWKIALEYLLLEIDLYARAKDAKLQQYAAPNTQPGKNEPENTSPFAKLQSLKN